MVEENSVASRQLVNQVGEDDEDDDEKEIWVPLAAFDDDDSGFVSSSTNADVAATQGVSFSGVDNIRSFPSNRQSSFQSHDGRRPGASGSVSGGDQQKQSDSLHGIKSRIQTRISLQNNLVNHPIDMFWKRFLLNILRELWTLEILIRLGLLCLGAGLIARLFVWSFWYVLYPRVAILSLIFIASIIYLEPFQMQSQIRAIIDIFLSPENVLQVIERLDTQHIRRLSFVLFFVPTFLEMRTLSFLSQIKAETGWMAYNLGLGGILLGTMIFLMKYKRMKPREATYQGMLLAYGSALLVSIHSFNVRRMPFLAAPFLTATGTLLITYQDDDMEWLSRVVRQALRVTLRDVLASVGSKVSEDEMLQLAILRWISDFWANNPGPSQSQTSSNAQGKEGTESPSESGEEQPVQDSTSSPNAKTSTSSVSSTRESNQPSYSSNFEQRDVQWDELLPMLNIEIDHMEVEAQAQAGALHPNTNEAVQHDISRPSSSAPSHANPTTGSSPFDDLKAMLLSLNIDDKAKPAVMAYRRGVESLPPQKRTAFALSILRRCPALLTLVFHILLGGTSSLFASFIFLLPFVVMEYFRIAQWIATCQSVDQTVGAGNMEAQENHWMVPKTLNNVDTMTILLCGDYHTALRPPTLLRVWHNIVSSVAALEVGLTAARCAETTAVAVEFAGSVLSLVQFGMEVSQHGLLHGLAVVVREAISIGGDFSKLDGMDEETVRYTRAAVQAVHSGQRVARNVQVLSEDEHFGAIVQPILATLSFLSGHRWLWGKEDSASASSVIIEEVHELDITSDSDAAESSIKFDALLTTRGTTLDTTSSETPLASDVASREGSEPSMAKQIVQSAGTEAVRPMSTPPTNDLSEVMEMVSIAYENRLIEDKEKSEFYEQLSKFSKDELSNPSVLLSMKRTLQIVLENGSLTEPIGEEFSGDALLGVHNDSRLPSEDKVLDPKEQEVMSLSKEEILQSSAASKSRDHHDSLQFFDECQSADFLPIDDFENAETNTQESAARDSVGVHENDNQEAQSSDCEHHDNSLLKFGAAALGVLGGALLLSMANRKDGSENDDRQNETVNPEESEERRDRSTVVIEELSEGDNEWVTIPQ